MPLTDGVSFTELQERVRLAQARGRILTAIAIGMVCILVGASLVFGFLTLNDKHDSDRVNAAQIEALRVDLAAARTQLASADVVQKETDSCSARYGNVVAEKLADYIAAIGDIGVAAGQAQPLPIAALGDALGAYRAAIRGRAAWQDADQPLPCPLP